MGSGSFILIARGGIEQNLRVPDPYIINII